MFIESQLKFEELKKRLEKELTQKTDLEEQMKTLHEQDESSQTKVIMFVVIYI